VLKLCESGTQYVLVGAAAGAATGELPINHDGRHAADAVLLRFGSDFGKRMRPHTSFNFRRL